MVDHRAENDGNFRGFPGRGADEPLTLSERFDMAWASLFGPKDDGNAGARGADRGFIARFADLPDMTRIALAATIIWVLALGAYGFGFYLRVGADETGTRVLPTMDLLFFAFAIAGPLAMLWIVVAMLGRTAHLTGTIARQSESAEALAVTLGRLNESIDALSAGTTGRLEQACDRMEREASASTAALERHLDGVATKLETMLSDSVAAMDAQLQDRMEKLDTHSMQRLNTLESAVSQQQEAVDQRLNDDARHLALTIGAEVDALRRLRGEMAERIDAGLTESRLRMEEAAGKVLAGHGTALKTARETLSATFGEIAETAQTASETTQAEVRSGLEASARQVHAKLGELSTRMVEFQDQQGRLVREDLIAPVKALGATVDTTQRSLAANPPATPQAIADLLGQAARRMIEAERQMLEEGVARIGRLEKQAEVMLERIDRTARLNAALEQDDGPAPDAMAAIVSDTADAELPFAELPRAQHASALNWGAVVTVLDGAEPHPGARAAVARVAEDADVVRLLQFYSAIRSELAEERVYPEDLKPEHAPGPVWMRFARGARGGEISALAGVSDEITNALVRTRLRASPDFLAQAIRFTAAYAGLVERAAGEVSGDHRLVELAETGPGRCFVLLAGLLGVFERSATSSDAA